MTHTSDSWIVDFQESKPVGLVPVAINNTWGKRIVNQVMGESRASAIANAYLIAAAPKLLGALEEARDFIRGFEDDEAQEGMEALMSLITNAISEATGN